MIKYSKTTFMATIIQKLVFKNTDTKQLYEAASLDKGWHGHYWNPWKQHLAGKPITRPEE